MTMTTWSGVHTAATAGHAANRASTPNPPAMARDARRQRSVIRGAQRVDTIQPFIEYGKTRLLMLQQISSKNSRIVQQGGPLPERQYQPARLHDKRVEIADALSLFVLSSFRDTGNQIVGP